MSSDEEDAAPGELQVDLGKDETRRIVMFAWALGSVDDAIRRKALRRLAHLFSTTRRECDNHDCMTAYMRSHV